MIRFNIKSKCILVLGVLLLFIESINAQNSFIKTDSISCTDSLSFKGLGYPTWSVPEIIIKPKFGYARILEDQGFYSMKYWAPPCFRGLDTIVVLCAKATQLTCDTGIYVIHIGCDTIANRVEFHKLNCKDSLETIVGAFGLSQIMEGPFIGSAKIRKAGDWALLVYTPDSLFQGMDYVKLNMFNGAEIWQYIYHVDCKIVSDSKEMELERSVFYPNPVSGDKLLIENQWPILKKVFLINSLGIPLTINCTIEENKISIDLHHFPNGYYSLILEEDSRRIIHKILILH